jgi:hypothetical protein
LGTTGERQWPASSRREKSKLPNRAKNGDGGNLYLIVSNTASRKWVLRFTWRGRPKEMGLGSAAIVPLADAREKAAGVYAIDERKRTEGIPTFGEVANDVREALSAGVSGAQATGEGFEHRFVHYGEAVRDARSV